jgi:hypothetical protein
MNPFYDHFKYLATRGAGGGNDERDIGDVYRGVLYQRGYGLEYDAISYNDMHGLGFADGLMSMFKFVLPALKTGLQYLGKHAVSTAANIATDAIAGRNIAESAKDHVTDTAKDLFAKAPDALSSVIRGGQKRRWNSSLETAGEEGGRLIKRVAKKKRKLSYKSRNKYRAIGKGLLSTYPALEKIV